jgi:uncharacterized membrane protein YbhN (UPF0104 family)
MRARTLAYVRILSAALSLVVLFHFVPLGDTLAALRDIDFLWFSIAVIAQFLVRAVGTFRMQVVAANQGITISLPQLYRLLLSAHFYSVLLPGPLVGGGASWIKYMQHGADTHAAAATVLVNRAIGVGMQVTLGACAWALDRVSGVPILGIGCVVAALFMFAIVVLAPPRRGDEQLRVSGSGLRRIFTEMPGRLMLFRRIPRYGKFVILTSALVQDLLGTAVMLGFAMAVGIHVDFLTVLWIRAALSLVLMLPVTVAGLGVREASLVGLSALIGVDPVTAVSWSFAILAGTLIVAAVGGLVEANAATGGISRYLEGHRTQDSVKRGDT